MIPGGFCKTQTELRLDSGFDRKGNPVITLLLRCYADGLIRAFAPLGEHFYF